MEQAVSTSLGAGARAAYERDGYLAIDPGLPVALLDQVVAELAAAWDRSPSSPGHVNAHRIRDAWKACPGVRQVACAPAVSAALSALYGRRAWPFQTLNFLVGSEQLPHADTIHFSSQPGGYVAGAWLAIEDVGPDQGPLVIYPGSHRLPELTMEGLGLSSDKTSYRGYEARIGELIARHGLEPKPVHLKRGQALLWHGNLLHGGAPRRDRLATRLSQATHFVFEGCRYFTPLRSRGARLYVTNPIRIHAERTPLSEQLRRAARLASPWYLKNFAIQNTLHIARELRSR